MSHIHQPTREHPDEKAPKANRTPWTVLAVALTAQIAVVCDISVVNTALPTIATALKLGKNDLQAIVTAYLMLSGGGLLLGGRIADLVSRRTVFLVGLAAFTLASLASGFATDATWLIAARATQGASAALLTPSALSLIMTTYDGDQRRKGLAAWGLVGSLGVAAGVLFGGALTTWFNWQLIFWINVPVGVVALIAGIRTIPRNQQQGSMPQAKVRQFDLPGAAAAIGGLSTLVFALSGTSTHGWTSARTLGWFTLSGVLLVGFLLWERHATQPLFPAHVWQVKTLVSGTTLMLGVTGILVGIVFLTSILVQAELGYSALKAGVAFLPFAFAITLGAVVARHAMAHLAPRVVAAAGFVVTAGAAGLLANLPEHVHYASNLLPGLVALGVGVGLVFAPVSVTAMAGIPESHAGLASGFLMTGHEVGAALGVAVLSAAANAAGSLTDPSQVGDAFTRGALVAGGIALVLAVLAWVRMPAAKLSGAAGMHMHH